MILKEFETLAEFYPFYLSEHANRTCRRLHVLGSSFGLGCVLAALTSGQWWFWPLGLVGAYGFAWVGHYFFERNRPATFDYPLYSFVCDWLMLRDIFRGRIAI